jgi:hypothetical protein
VKWPCEPSAVEVVTHRKWYHASGASRCEHDHQGRVWIFARGKSRRTVHKFGAGGPLLQVGHVHSHDVIASIQRDLKPVPSQCDSGITQGMSYMHAGGLEEAPPPSRCLPPVTSRDRHHYFPTNHRLGDDHRLYQSQAQALRCKC